MAEQLAENYHNTWAKKKKFELGSKGKASLPLSWSTENLTYSAKKKYVNLLE